METVSCLKRKHFFPEYIIEFKVSRSETNTKLFKLFRDLDLDLETLDFRSIVETRGKMGWIQRLLNMKTTSCLG